MPNPSWMLGNGIDRGIKMNRRWLVATSACILSLQLGFAQQIEEMQEYEQAELIEARGADYSTAELYYVDQGEDSVNENADCPSVECAETKYPVIATPPDDECWSLTVRYEPSYYTTQRCIEQEVPYKRQACRYVSKYYEVQRVRYIPEYYTETICRTEPEFYEVEGSRMQKRWVTEQQCEYVPCYYWQNACGEEIRAPNPVE